MGPAYRARLVSTLTDVLGITFGRAAPDTGDAGSDEDPADLPLHGDG
jgi:hypothetical protein